MLALLLCFIFVSSFATDSLELGESEHEPNSAAPSFFGNITTSAKTAYYKILNDKALTRRQQAERILQWGKENGIEPRVKLFIDKKAKELRDFRENVTTFLKQLVDYEKEIDAIYLDNDITVSQRENLLHTLKCPPALKKVLSYAATVVRRSGAPPPFIKTDEVLPTVAVEPISLPQTKNVTI